MGEAGAWPPSFTPRAFQKLGGWRWGARQLLCVIPYTRRPEFNFSKRIRVLRTLQGPYCHVARP